MRTHALRQVDSPVTAWGRFSRTVYDQRRRFATLAAAALAVALGYHVVFGQNGLTTYEHKRADARMLNQQVRRLTEENQQLQGHVQRLQDDPGAIEHQAREELHYTRPGEVIVTLPDQPAAKTASPAATQQ